MCASYREKEDLHAAPATQRNQDEDALIFYGGKRLNPHLEQTCESGGVIAARLATLEGDNTSLRSQVQKLASQKVQRALTSSIAHYTTLYLIY